MRKEGKRERVEAMGGGIEPTSPSFQTHASTTKPGSLTPNPNIINHHRLKPPPPFESPPPTLGRHRRAQSNHLDLPDRNPITTRPQPPPFATKSRSKASPETHQIWVVSLSVRSPFVVPWPPATSPYRGGPNHTFFSPVRRRLSLVGKTKELSVPSHPPRLALLAAKVPMLRPRVNPYGPKVTPWVAPTPIGPRVSPYGYSSGELYKEYGWRISVEMSARRGHRPARARGRPARYADLIDDPIPDPPPPVDPPAPEVPPIPRGQTTVTDPPPAPSIDVTTPVRGASAVGPQPVAGLFDENLGRQFLQLIQGAVRAANVVPEVPISQTLISSGVRIFTGSPDGAPTDAED
ncbi:hypothetical protein V6N12_019868 [Hibiscus sabdariffa]|uniref:Uncharacterized protein n=1 Tax=Hibiscus sabdariffa TaxID=183260 RepID=A0ABR2B292_9ROSI